jgi:hypothetical protein
MTYALGGLRVRIGMRMDGSCNGYINVKYQINTCNGVKCLAPMRMGEKKKEEERCSSSFDDAGRAPASRGLIAGLA